MMTELSLKTFEMDEVLKDDAFVARLRQLSLGGFSGMNVALNAFIAEKDNRHIDAKAIVAYMVDKHGLGENLSNARGWALWTKDESTDRFRKKSGIIFQVYVESSYRRQGIASKLLKKAVALSGNEPTMVYWHDEPDFFQRHQDEGYNIVNIYNY